MKLKPCAHTQITIKLQFNLKKIQLQTEYVAASNAFKLHFDSNHTHIHNYSLYYSLI